MAALIVLVALVVFFSSSEGDGVPLLDWIRDPAYSRARHEVFVADQRAAAEALDSPVGEGPRSPRDAPRPRDERALEALLELAPSPVRGRVQRLDGSPLAGLAVTAVHPTLAPVSAPSELDGSFSLQLGDLAGTLRLDDPAWILLGGDQRISRVGLGDHVLVAVERVDLAGQVVDVEGLPLEGVEVVASTLVAAAAAPELARDLPAQITRSTLTDEDGRFALPGLPALASLLLELRKPGYRPLRRPPPVESVDDLLITLEAEDDGGR